MEPLGLIERGTGELAILHRCSRCGKLQPNRVAGDDDVELLLKIVEARQQSDRIEGYLVLSVDALPRVATALLGTVAATRWLDQRV
jgi:hypothetical protein